MKRYSKNQEFKLIICFALCIAVFIAAFAFNRNIFGKDSIFGEAEDDVKSFVKVIDVGQGDCILIYSKGYSALIDTGTSDSSDAVCKAIRDCGIKQIDVLLISHYHTDHTGGIPAICDNFAVSNLVMPEISIESEGLTAAEYAIGSVTKSGGKIYTAKQGMNFKIGDFEITVLAAFPNADGENNRSIISMAQISEKKFLFTGDIEAKAERMLLNENLNLECDVLKVAHHGSGGSSTMNFLNAANPRYAVISVGKDNMYGHPHNNALSSFEYIGAKLYRTDLNGTVTFYINNGVISPHAER